MNRTEAIAARLTGTRARIRATGNGFMALCPAHDDRNPSLSVSEKDGTILLHCFAAGCSASPAELYAAVEKAIGEPVNARHRRQAHPSPSYGRTGVTASPHPDRCQPRHRTIVPVPADAPDVADLIEARAGPHPWQLWSYHDADGRLLCHVVRIDGPRGKTIAPYKFADTDTGPRWVQGAIETPRPLYNLPQIVTEPDRPVLIVEGEKCCDAARLLLPNWIATTNAGGANAVHLTDFTPLKGRIVIIARDHDRAGDIAAATAAAKAEAAGAARIGLFRIPECVDLDNAQLIWRPRIPTASEDIADLVARGWRHHHLRTIVSQGLSLVVPIGNASTLWT